MKVGNKIVCIDNSRLDLTINLTKGKIYIIDDINNNFVKVQNNRVFYIISRFIVLKEYRKMKLEKIDEGRR